MTWNRAAERLCGYTAREVLGQPVLFVFPPERRTETAPLLERLGSGDKVTSDEATWLRKDGTAIDVALTISPICDRSQNPMGRPSSLATSPSSGRWPPPSLRPSTSSRPPSRRPGPRKPGAGVPRRRRPPAADPGDRHPGLCRDPVARPRPGPRRRALGPPGPGDRPGRSADQGPAPDGTPRPGDRRHAPTL
ncbi:MAG: PAS domain S-box protein [Actinobacteria bacterium]|nr:PAS domain S-box protein [Actinomycetota bacterium]